MKTQIGTMAERAANWANNPLTRTRSADQIIRRFRSDIQSFGEPLTAYMVISFNDGTNIARNGKSVWTAYGRPRASR